MNINSIGDIAKFVIKTGNSPSFTKLPDMPNDIFVKSTQAIDDVALKVNDALKKAFKFCRESVMGENPIESQMAFDSTGKVLYTNTGNKKTCKLEYDKLTPNSTAIHSHPDACTLSIEDIMVLVTEPNLKMVGSIDPQGRTCILEKPQMYSTPSQKEAKQLKNSLYATLRSHWTEALGVPENCKQICIQENEKRLLDAFGCESIDDVYKYLGAEKTGIFEQDMDVMSCLMCFPEVISKGYPTEPLGRYDPQWGAVTLEIEKIKATPEGIEIGNQFLQKIASTLGFEFKSGQI